MRPVILLDVDGVLADFVGFYIEALEWCKVQARRETIVNEDIPGCLQLTAHQRRTAEKVIESPGAAGRIKALDGAATAVSTLRNMGRVVFVTTPWPGADTWVHDRYQWLGVLFGCRSEDYFPVADKSLIAGDVMIDDNMRNVVMWHRPERLTLLWDTPHNRSSEPPAGIDRVSDWDAVFVAVRNHLGQ